MGLLYKDKKDQTISCWMKITEEGKVTLDFSSDCGKFGTDEALAGFIFTPERLLAILQDREDITDEELS